MINEGDGTVSETKIMMWITTKEVGGDPFSVVYNAGNGLMYGVNLNSDTVSFMGRDFEVYRY